MRRYILHSQKIKMIKAEFQFNLLIIFLHLTSQKKYNNGKYYFKRQRF